MRRGLPATALTLWVLLSLGPVGCDDPPPPESPASFSRPERVAFACLDLSEATPQAADMACCQEDPLCFLHALVTQSATGEVAAVDLVEGRVKDSRSDVPGYTFVPTGELPTAIAVGQAQGGPHHTYVANRGSGDISVLSTAGLRKLAPGELGDVQQPLRLHGRPHDMVLVSTPQGEGLLVSMPDQGLLLHIPIRADDGTLDGAGITELRPRAATQAPEVAPDFAEPYFFHHDSLDADGNAGPVCSRYALQEPGATPPPAPPLPDTGEPARPQSMVVDGFCPPGEPDCAPRVLVADERWSQIHVVSFDGGTPTLGEPLVTNAPTSHVVATPWVPSAAPGLPLPEGAPEYTRYVYAIDATDGSVMVLQDGRTLAVNDDPRLRSDRLALPASGHAVATVIEVMYPGFDPESADAAQYIEVDAQNQRSPTETEIRNSCFGDNSDGHDARNLRGVFVAVGLADGTIHVVDIHDLELASCSACPVAVRRHAPRLREGYRGDGDEDPPESLARIVPGAPFFRYGDRTLQVRPNGKTIEATIAGLRCIECGEGGKTRAFPLEDDITTEESAPTDGGLLDGGMADGGLPDGGAADEDDPEEAAGCEGDQALICAETDPWSLADDNWALTYQGSIPGTQGGGGLFTANGPDLAFVTDLDPCGAGVLGTDELGEVKIGEDAMGRAIYRGRGDLLVIVNDFPSDEAWEQLDSGDRNACEALRDAREDNPRDRMSFIIQRAERTETGGRFVVEPTFAETIGSYTRGDRDDWRVVNTCLLNVPLSFEVRVNRGYRVSSTSDIVHRVVASPDDGHCMQDPEADPRLTFRAFPGVRFENHAITFELLAQTVVPTDENISLSFSTRSQPGTLWFDGRDARTGLYEGVLPVDLRYNPVDGRLYAVDVHVRGLIPIDLTPFSTIVPRSRHFN